MLSSFPSLSGTFGIYARLLLNPKMPKEPSSPSRSNAQTEKRFTNEQIGDEMKQGQRTTRNIRKPGVMSKFKFCTFTKNYNGLISWSSEIPASAYCHPFRGMPAASPGTAPANRLRGICRRHIPRTMAKRH